MLREQVEQVLNQLTERERWCCSCALAWKMVTAARWRRSARSSASHASAFARSRSRRRKLRHPRLGKKLRDYLE